MYKKNKQGLPEELKKFFWDVDFDKLNLQDHRIFILERMLNYGTFDTFGWIFSSFSRKEVNDLIVKIGGHSLSKNSLLFWTKIANAKELWKLNDFKRH